MSIDIAGFGAIANFAEAVLDRYVPDPAAKAAAILEMTKESNAKELAQMAADNSLVLAQLDINKVEAASGSMFVAGGRPAVIWIGAFGLAYVSLVEPIARFVAQVGFKYAGAFPVIDTSITSQVLFGLLGIAGMRSYDKSQGTATTKITSAK